MLQRLKEANLGFSRRLHFPESRLDGGTAHNVPSCQVGVASSCRNHNYTGLISIYTFLSGIYFNLQRKLIFGGLFDVEGGRFA